MVSQASAPRLARHLPHGAAGTAAAVPARHRAVQNAHLFAAGVVSASKRSSGSEGEGGGSRVLLTGLAAGFVDPRDPCS